jgi:peptide/nickel transport system permease protein
LTASLDPEFAADSADLALLAPSTAPSAHEDPGTPRRRFGILNSVITQPGLVLAVVIIALALMFCIAPRLFTSQSADTPDYTAILKAPSAAHWFGTDNVGRDIFTRVVYGAHITLSATLLAVAIGFVIGSALGLVAGSVGGAVDLVIMRIVDILLAVPGLLLTLVIVTALGYGTMHVAIAVGISAVASFARVMRSDVLRVMKSDYVEAAWSIGTHKAGILLRYVLPNSLSSVVSLVPLQFGYSILSIAALGFLGFGAPPPQPEWGQMVAEGQDLLPVAPWAALLPGLVIMLVVLSTNRISRSLQTEGRLR